MSQVAHPPTFLDHVKGHIQLLDPITWLGPWQSLCCSVIMVGLRPAEIDAFKVAKFCLACGLIGPLLTGFSQSINDYFDRHLDAVNDPDRPIPSGRVSLGAARANFILTGLLSLGNIATMYVLTDDPTFVWIGLIGLVLAAAYSLPGLRFKENGWLGTTSVGIGYCFVPWVLGAMLFAPDRFSWPHLLLGGVNALVAMGLITMNDFKAIEGDRENGLRTIPVMYGVRGAMLIAFLEITLAQILLIGGAVYLKHYVIAVLAVVFLIPQTIQQIQLYRSPEGNELFNKISNSRAGQTLMTTNQKGAHSGFIRYLIFANLLLVTEMTAFSIAQGYFKI